MQPLIKPLLLLSVALLALVQSTHAGDCQWTDPESGTSFDLSPLTVPENGETYVVQDRDFTYAMNICAPERGNDNCAQKNGTICQFSANRLVATIARQAAPIYSLVDSDHPELGLVQQFTNGDPCGTTARQATIKFLCDASKDTPTITGQEDQSVCTYTYLVRSKYACPVGTGGGSKLTAVSPAVVPLFAFNEVHISGSQLPTDWTLIESVTLAGVAADLLTTSETEIVVQAKPVPTAVSGDVVVTLTDGTIIKSGTRNMFTYSDAPCFPKEIYVDMYQADPQWGLLRSTIVQSTKLQATAMNVWLGVENTTLPAIQVVDEVGTLYIISPDDSCVRLPSGDFFPYCLSGVFRVDTATVGSVAVDVMVDFNRTSVSMLQSKSRIPMSENGGSHASFANAYVGNIDPGYFKLPEQCNHNQVRTLATGSDSRAERRKAVRDHLATLELDSLPDNIVHFFKL